MSQINKLDKAVAAAHTFFQANLDHTEMKQNLDYYKMMTGVEEEHFKDLEAREHMVITHSTRSCQRGMFLLPTVFQYRFNHSFGSWVYFLV